MQAPRTFLFLQGPPGLFWLRLAEGLRAAGQRTIRVNLNLGDRVWWPARGALNYRGRLRDWPGWLERLIEREGVTDILYYADRLPYHIAALEVAKPRGIRVHAIEYGYLRPDWLTHEPEAMGRHSTIPRDPAAIRAMAAGQPVPDMTLRYPHSFFQETWREVSWNLLMVYGRPFYPFYVSDKYYWPVLEYIAWLVRLAFHKATSARDEALVDLCLSGAFRYTLVALQLQLDYQIRASTDYGHIEEMLEEIMASFAADAPADRHLVIKTHPLDCGLEFWHRRVRRLARRFGVKGRVHVLDSLRLVALLRQSEGVILANSTVGLHALADGVPVLALGDAVYVMPGLTHQSGLARFWAAPEPVDLDLARDLRRALAARYQVRGSFFNPEGVRVAVATLVARLTG